MSDKVRTGLIILVVLLIALPLVSQLMGEKKKPETAASPNRAMPSPANPPFNATPTQPAPYYAPQPASAPPPVAPPPQAQGKGKAPAQLNAQSLANTAWTISHPQYGQVTVQLFANGTADASGASIPFPVQGTWTVSGSTLNVSAMGQSISAQIRGNQLVGPNGVTAQRLR